MSEPVDIQKISSLPWAVSSDPEMPGAVVVDSKGVMVCDANIFGPDACTDEMNMANAQLIANAANAYAVAPNVAVVLGLVEVCEDIKKEWRNGHPPSRAEITRLMDALAAVKEQK